MICPICGDSSGTIANSQNAGFFFSKCKNRHTFHASNDLVTSNDDIKNRLFNMIAEFLLRRPTYNGQYWYFYYEPTYHTQDTDKPNYINLAEMESSYPDTFIERANRSIINLSLLHPRFGQEFSFEYINKRATFCQDIDANTETTGFLKCMCEIGYLSQIPGVEKYTISSDGWKKTDEINKMRNRKKQGFLALQFGTETGEIRETIRLAMKDAHYDMMVIDEKEHNDQIVPEIFYEINSSSFLVVDVTHPNFGAYYEAGYAQGHGIEVIACCKKEVFENSNHPSDKPHFDISQKSMVIWENYDDLRKRLTRRIIATVNMKI